MKLEELLEPFREIDQEILSYYAKAVKKFTRGNFSSKYIAAMPFALTAYALTVATLDSASHSSLRPFASDIYDSMSMATVADLIHTAYGRKIAYFKRNFLEQKSGSVALDPTLHKMDRISSCSRLPIMLAGIGLTLKGGIEIAYAITGEPALNESFAALYSGLSLICLASSMYIKGTDEDIAQRKPFFQKMYEGAMEKLGAILPAPKAAAPQLGSRYADY